MTARDLGRSACSLFVPIGAAIELFGLALLIAIIAEKIQ